VVSEKKTNIQLSLELKEVQKEKGARSNEKVAKAMKTQTLNPFTRKDTKAKKVKQWALQVEAYFESQAINTNVDRLKLVQSLLRDHALE
jgi:hypothetical protein